MNVIVLDLETVSSAEDCRYCGLSMKRWDDGPCENDMGHLTIGWDNHADLGLSIGCYFSYVDQRIHWFDEHTLEETMWYFVETQPLMVSFNGIGFDFRLMRALLRQREYAIDATVRRNEAHILCDQFKTLAAQSYDLLAEVWAADPERKFERGLNSLDAISQANGLGAKLSNGAQAPRDWAAGRYADVLNYCQSDVYLTKALFEQVTYGTPPGILMRRDGPLEIRAPIVTSDGKLAWGQRVW